MEVLIELRQALFLCTKITTCCCSQTRRLHALCANTLSNLESIEPTELARHHELGGLDWQATKLYVDCRRFSYQDRSIYFVIIRPRLFNSYQC